MRPTGLAADLELQGEDVTVGRAFGFGGTLTEERASGRLNGGGPRLEARSGDGSVVLKSDG